MKDEKVINGRGWNFGLLSILLSIPGLIVVIIGIIDGYWAVISFGMFLHFPFFLIALYALLLKKIVFNEIGVSYWIGRRKKFELRWTDIVKLRTRKYHSTFIVIYTTVKVYSLETAVIFSTNKMIQAFNILIENTRYNENIEIQDHMGWEYK